MMVMHRLCWAEYHHILAITDNDGCAVGLAVVTTTGDGAFAANRHWGRMWGALTVWNRYLGLVFTIFPRPQYDGRH